MADLSVQPLRCGTLKAAGKAFLTGLEGELTLQVWAFIIHHSSGTALFDTGMHAGVREDPDERLGDLSTIFAIDYGPSDDVVSRLEGAQVGADEVDVVVASHFHFDHAGGNSSLPEARVIVQQAELDHAGHEEGGGYVHADWDTGQDLEVVAGEHDVFGDGRVLCIPTFGHTPGHQSLLVRLDAGDLLLTADACYIRQSLEERALPRFGWDRERQLAVLNGFAQRESRGAVLVFGHDPVLSPEATAMMGRPPS
jgi:N-acyl homoserine lactone hydrolase